MINKCYKEIKNVAASKKDSSSSEAIPLVNLMKQVQEVSVNVLDSTLSLISTSPKAAAKWSLVSKLLQQNKASSQEIPFMQKMQAELKSYKEGDVVQTRKLLRTLIQFEELYTIFLKHYKRESTTNVEYFFPKNLKN
ncbi:OLC1v1018391C2 [Oldenlandia corymbosa var. corymbosa]|nr:OLC1v1018391C2 [Oldenlandia corymbosa var. corymbosa]